MPSMARGVAYAGKGNQDDDDAVEFFAEKKTVLKNKPADDVSDGIRRHQQDAGREGKRFYSAYDRVYSAEKTRQAGFMLVGFFFAH